ncbi:hypothetical protein TraAM80_03573 [Trypanosoma rangeli]|uniref:Uncharacterized protein n=1 Tax=Trypanosoma rangeli TaxID=5698 RepID=A0A3R7NIP4_TRYRA|nr:uncharacterized protein TraAM80_03573 [Trypanosoma rangeli]RNF07086.1 hypothetical protein TraAM80_03573 [Trypanosoma rangeli]|eukprot:RNF07086.1 hypothetical protein TraAM80_03573 [Trypanosoma rangeli]
MTNTPFSSPQDDERLLSISPLSDVGLPGQRSPRGASLVRRASTEVSFLCHGAAPARCGACVLGFSSTATKCSFGVLLDADSTATKHAKEPKSHVRCRDQCASSSSSAASLSWNTVALLTNHTYLFDVVCSAMGSAAFFRSPAPQSADSLETFPSVLSLSPPAITAWEHLLCAVLFRTSVEEAAALRHAVSWEEQCRVEDVLAEVRRCTRALVDGLLRWVPASAGVRLLLSRHSDGDSRCCWGGSRGGIQVGLLDVENVWRVQQHLFSLQRSWLSTDEEGKCRDVAMGLRAAARGVRDVDPLREALYRTLRAFQRQSVHLLRWAADSHGEAYTASTQLLVRVMAVVAHIEFCLESSPQSRDTGALYCHDDVEGSRGGGDASGLPFTPAQRDHLVEMLAVLMHPCSDNTSGEGRRLAMHWLWAHLRGETNAALFTGPSRLLFHDFLASFAHWLVLHLVPALMVHVNALSCGDQVNAAPPPARSVRVRFNCAEESSADEAELLSASSVTPPRVPTKTAPHTSFPSSSAAVIAAPAARRNVLLEITMTDWLWWLRHRSARDNEAVCGVEFFPSLSSTAARLLGVLDSLELFRPLPAGGVWPVLSDRVFERHGAWAVAHWVVGCSHAEILALRQEYAGGAPHASASRDPVVMFTLGDFIARYRPVVDAARVSSHLTSHPPWQEGDSAGDRQWRPLPPLFHISLENFNVFSPIIQAKLICSAVTVDYAAHASPREEEEAGVWRHVPSQRRMDIGVFNSEAVPAREAPSVVVMEDSGLVKVYDAGALEQLEGSRLRGRARLHGCGTRILQSFLRACWSVRWNFVPLRRRAQRHAIVLVQAALRVHAAALTATRQVRRLVEQQRRWVEERRSHDVTREQLVRRLEAQAAGRGNCDGDAGDAMHVASPAAQTAVSWPATPLDELLGARARRVPDPALGVERRLKEGGGPAALDLLLQKETWVETHSRGAVCDTERKGRGIIQHVEAKGRRQLFFALEDKLRERWLLQEYRDRRAVVQRQIKEHHESRGREQRRKWQKQRKQQAKVMQKQREETQSRSFATRARNEAPRRVVASSQPPTAAATTEVTCSGASYAPDTTNHDNADASEVVIVIDVPGDDGDTDGPVQEPQQLPRDVHKRPAEGAKNVAPSRNTRVCASLRSPHGGAAATANSCRTPRRALRQQEHEDRTFIELSQCYRWHVLLQTCALEGVAPAEMQHRRRIFLACALERQELLARWRTVVLPYGLITEALHGDFLAALVILQDTPRRHGLAARRQMSSRFHPLRVNTTPAGVRTQQSLPSSSCRRTGGRGFPQLLGKDGVMVGGNDENAVSTEQVADAKAKAVAHREFLCKPNFQLLAGHFSNPYASDAGAAVTDRRAPAKGGRGTSRPGKAPTTRRRVVTWVDLPPSSPQQQPTPFVSST